MVDSKVKLTALIGQVLGDMAAAKAASEGRDEEGLQGRRAKRDGATSCRMMGSAGPHLPPQVHLSCVWRDESTQL